MSLEDYASYDEDGMLKSVEAKDWSDRADEVLFNKEVMEIIEKAVSELPELYRIDFHLRDVKRFTNQEVPKVLGLSVGTVKSWLHREGVFLRDKLADHFSINGINNLYPTYMDLHLYG